MPIRFPILLALLALACSFVQAQPASVPAQAPAQVLYIGNSYTFYHDMPATVSAMGDAEGSPREIEAKVIAVSSATLQGHWETGTVLSALRAQKWDYVVLQEHSLGALEDKEQMYKYIRLFDKEIKRSGAKTVLLLTWARRDSPENQAVIDAAFGAIAAETGALVAPAGPAWQIARRSAPELALYDQDGSHPSRLGSYLAACVLYITLQPGQAQCPALSVRGISSRSRETLRAAAASAVAGRPR